MRGFAGEVADGGDARLHLAGDLVGGNARGEVGVAGEALEVAAVERLDEIARGAVGGGGDGRGPREVADGVGAVEIHTLIRGGQKTGSPVVDAALRFAARVGDGHVGGQRFVFAAERVRRPRAHTGKPIGGEAGAHEIFTGAVAVGFALHRVHPANVIGKLADVADEIADHLPALPITPEGIQRPREISLLPLRSDKAIGARQRLAVALGQLGFVIPSVHLADCAAAKDDENLLGFGRKMRRSRGVRVSGMDVRPNGFGGQQSVALQ